MSDTPQRSPIKVSASQSQEDLRSYELINEMLSDEDDQDGGHTMAEVKPLPKSELEQTQVQAKDEYDPEDMEVEEVPSPTPPPPAEPRRQQTSQTSLNNTIFKSLHIFMNEPSANYQQSSNMSSTNNTSNNQQPGLISGHAQYVKGAVEDTIGSVTGSHAWKSSGVQYKTQAVEAMKTVGENRDTSKGYGSVEQKAGELVGCEGMEKEGAASRKQ